jgi:hypothetical protein
MRHITEHTVQQDFKDHLEIEGAYVRIMQANMLMAGMPDMFICGVSGKILMVENKMWRNKYPPSDPVGSFRPLLRPPQRACIIANLWPKKSPVYVIAWTVMGYGYMTDGQTIYQDSLEHWATWIAKQ